MTGKKNCHRVLWVDFGGRGSFRQGGLEREVAGVVVGSWVRCNGCKSFRCDGSESEKAPLEVGCSGHQSGDWIVILLWFSHRGKQGVLERDSSIAPYCATQRVPYKA